MFKFNLKKMVLMLCLVLSGASLNAQQWEIDYGDANTYTKLTQSIVNRNGNAVIVGVTGNDDTHHHPLVIEVDTDGNYVSHVFEDDLFGMFTPIDVIQLNNGNYFISGSKGDNFMVAVFDSDFNEINAKRYMKPDVAISVYGCRLLLDDDGSVVASGGYDYQPSYGQKRKPYFYRFSANGDSLSCRFVTSELPHPEARIHSYDCFRLMKNPTEDGYIVLCRGLNGYGSVLLYDKDFNYSDGFSLQPGYRGLKDSFEDVYSDHWLTHGKLLICGRMNHTDVFPNLSFGMAQFNIDGTFDCYERIYYKQDTTIEAAFRSSMAYVNDSTIFEATNFFRDVSSGPYYTGILLCNTEMEILGRREFCEPEYESLIPTFIIALPDGNCLFNVEFFSLGHFSYGKLIKMSRDDFNPIPCSVTEVPQEAVKAIAYPNPAMDELNIDISGLPEGDECRVSIIDALGRVHLDRYIRGEGNVLTIGIGCLPAGVYGYRIYNADGEVIGGKFVKQ